MMVAMAACGGPQTTTGDGSAPSGPARGHALNEVELECRSKNNLDIGQLDAHYGPTCDSKTMPLTLKEFDLGTFGGLQEAKAWAWAKTMLCVCADGTCNEANELKAIELARKTMVDDLGKREREGVYRVTESLSHHSCLNATIGAELYKLGFHCGFTDGLHSQLIRRRMEEDFAAVYQDEPDLGRQRADACFRGLESTNPR